MEKLIKIINEKKEEILNTKYKHINKLEYFKDVYELLKKKNRKFYAQIDNCDFFAFVLDMLNRDYCVNPIVIWDLNYANSYNIEDLDDLLVYLQNHISKNGKDVNNIAIPTKIVNKQDIFTDADSLAMYLTILKDFFPENIIDNELNTNLIRFTLFKDEELEEDEIIEKLNKHSREIRRIVTKGIDLNRSTSYPTLNKLLKDLILHYEKMDRENDELEKEKRKKSGRLINLISVINNMLNMPYITITPELNKLLIDNPEIKKEVYRVILEHNEKSFYKLKKENNINNNNSISQLEKLFFEYNINPELLTSDQRIKLLQTKTIDELKDMFEILREPLFSFLNISNPEFVNILINSNSHILNDIKRYYKNGIIRQNYIENNTKILIPDDTNKNGLYYVLKENIKTLEKYRIKWDMISDDEMNFLLYNPDKIKTIISCLEKYFVPFNQEACYFFLEHPELINYIDLYIEIKEFDLLTEQPESLTKLEVFKRLVVSKIIIYSVLNDNNYIRNSILTGKNFYVHDKEVDRYIINHTDKYIDKNAKQELDENDHFQISDNIFDYEEINNLEQNFKINELMYDFNGIIISRPKVLRCFEYLSHGNYNVNNNLFSSILYNSNLSSEQIEEIKSLLFSKKLK